MKVLLVSLWIVDSHMLYMCSLIEMEISNQLADTIHKYGYIGFILC